MENSSASDAGFALGDFFRKSGFHAKRAVPEEQTMFSTITGHTSLLLPAVISGIFTACLFGMSSNRLTGLLRTLTLAAASLCIIGVILGTLVYEGEHEEIVCYLLCLLLTALIAMRFRKGGGS